MSEELYQKGYIRKDGRIFGDPWGSYERFSLGATTLKELKRWGIVSGYANSIRFLPQLYKIENLDDAKPDVVVVLRKRKGREPVLVGEHKKPGELRSKAGQRKALEQCVCYGEALSAPLGYVTDHQRYFWVDIRASVEAGEVQILPENREPSPHVLDELLSPAGEQRDPTVLVEPVWQAIWHATKAEPKDCLLTFVELFVYKFICDNVDERHFPNSCRISSLLTDVERFRADHGCTQIEYYIRHVRPRIKELFPEQTAVQDPTLKELYGFETVVSRTSVINGFAFLATGEKGIDVFNDTFLELLWTFQDFGPLTRINPEFKSRLYEKFLRRSLTQGRLGQFFTPRNVIRAITRMADLGSLPDGAVVLDPACGVGGFILEPLLHKDSLGDNYRLHGGRYEGRVKLVGADVDVSTHVLAKANMLIHLAEEIRGVHADINALNALMAKTFVVLDENKHLGSLMHPIREKVDVVLTNPPYVTQGSAIYKREIEKYGHLQDFYEKSGLGLESLFLRYIVEALKPGGWAFVIVPQGLLARTEPTVKSFVLEKCFLRGIISLPRNTFYATPQKTYVLCLQKRRPKETHAQTEPIFCYLTGEIGETRDAQRLPCRNDLEQAAEQFLLFRGNPKVYVSQDKRIKIVPPSQLTPHDRWDIQRFWTEEELAELGDETGFLEKTTFLSETEENLRNLVRSAAQVRRLLASLEGGPMKPVLLGDTRFFVIERGVRVTRSDARKHPGEIPVYSGSKDPSRPLAMVSEEWAHKTGIPVQHYPCITVNANGLVGEVFYRTGRFIVHDDVNIVRILGRLALFAENTHEPTGESFNKIREYLNQLLHKLSQGDPKDKIQIEEVLNMDLAAFISNLPKLWQEDHAGTKAKLKHWLLSYLLEKYEVLAPLIVPEYLKWALKESINRERFEYGAKLYSARLKKISVLIPVTSDGADFDLERQRALAEAHEKLDEFRREIESLGRWAAAVKLQ